MLVSGQWALVTGASSGLGEQFAKQLAARGLSLVLTARSKDALEHLAAELSSAHGVGTRVIVADLSTEAGIDALLHDVRALGLPIDHLIGNAGFGTQGSFAEQDTDEQRAMVRLNCEAIVALSGALVPAMIERSKGGVIHVASTAAFQPAATFTTYAATKAFVLSFTEALHEEVRPHGVRAMALCPGPIPTGFQARARTSLAGITKPMVVGADRAVREALEDYEHGRAICIPGQLNRTGAWLAQLAPRSLVRRVTHELMRRGATGAN